MKLAYVAGCVLTCLGATLIGAEPRVPTHDDIVNLSRVASPAISPDGSRVAYTVRETNWD